MGRYYTGDIEGKFWFGLQSSFCGQRFGAMEEEPQYKIFYTDDIEIVNKELRAIRKLLGNKIKILNTFFKKNPCYCDNDLEKMGISRDDLREYADYKFGLKMKKSIEENGHCGYEAEI